MKKPLIVIAGPTACGKTDLSIELAKKIGGEIISGDSMQVYKFMDIGTAKPTKEEMCGIPHFLIDELYPDEAYMAEGTYQLLSGERDFILTPLFMTMILPRKKKAASGRNFTGLLKKRGRKNCIVCSPR